MEPVERRRGSSNHLPCRTLEGVGVEEEGTVARSGVNVAVGKQLVWKILPPQWIELISGYIQNLQTILEEGWSESCMREVTPIWNSSLAAPTFESVELNNHASHFVKALRSNIVCEPRKRKRSRIDDIGQVEADPPPTPGHTSVRHRLPIKLHSSGQSRLSAITLD
ncbi:hypothetical protein CDAR_282381 [Caerostris darwini]|uniref:Uncharacterized protein n=1 Tax=Caerostris darwini TaxID=1538125 RepID=A0AAV4MMT9_9ARAC|nr:hypothetical protein CDAR_282381 [Caerostris darwini]